MKSKLRWSLQYKLLLAFILVTVLPLILVSYITTTRITKQFQESNKARIRNVLAQAIRQYKQYGALARSKIDKAARAREINDIGIKINVSGQVGGQSIYELLAAEHITESAKQVAESLELDVFSILSEDGTIISSAHWPAKFGYKNSDLARMATAHENTPFLIREETSDEQFLTIQSTRFVKFDYGPNKLIVAGGYRLFSPDFVARVQSSGDAVVLFFDASKQSWHALTETDDIETFSKQVALRNLVDQVTNKRGNLLLDSEEKKTDINLQEISSKNHNYVFTAIPLVSAMNTPLGALVIGLSQDDVYTFLSQMKLFSYGAAIIGILSAVALSALLALRVTGPVQKLSKAVGSMAMGDLDQKIDIRSHDEIGMLSAAFNKMALDLKSHREKLLQAERVAAWREMARRLAHELKNPLFPIQVSIETMVKAEHRNADAFQKIFSECTRTVLEEINSLKKIINEFSEFARMPRPVFAPVSLNEVVEQSLSLFTNQMDQVTLSVYLDDGLPPIMADKDHIGRVIKNLVGNALEAMPSGGRLDVTTHKQGDEWVLLKISDTGVGMSEEAKRRLFTPYYTTKPRGTGLGLAIVQSIVADHHGKISVQSSVGQGTTFEIELPRDQAKYA